MFHQHTGSRVGRNVLLIMAMLVGSMMLSSPAEAQPGLSCIEGTLQGSVCVIVGAPPVPGPLECPVSATVLQDGSECYTLVVRTALGECPVGATPDPNSNDCRRPVALLPGALMCEADFGLVDGECLRYEDPVLTASQDSLYVFGDSFASGEGSSYYVPYTDTPENDCHKSLVSFGFRLFGSLNPNGTESPEANFPTRFFPACSGAKTEDIFTVDQEGDGTQISQVTRVADGTTGIALSTLGANDLGFTPVMTECVLTVACHTDSDLPQIVNVDANMKQLGRDLFNVYKDIESHVDGTGDMKVYVVGYPQLFASSGPLFCGSALGFEPAERAWANQQAKRMNQVMYVVTLLLPDVEYINIDPYFEGHRLCDPDPWILGISLPIKHSFHPSTAGHALVEGIVLDRLQADGYGG